MSVEDFQAKDGKIHVESSKRVYFNGELLPKSENSELVNSVLENPDRYESQNVDCLNLVKDELQLSIVEIENEETKTYHVAVKDGEKYNVFDFDVVSNPMEERKATPCWSYNVVDRRPKAKNHLVSQVETFFHNFWYCPYHL